MTTAGMYVQYCGKQEQTTSRYDEIGMKETTAEEQLRCLKEIIRNIIRNKKTTKLRSTLNLFYIKQRYRYLHYNTNPRYAQVQ